MRHLSLARASIAGAVLVAALGPSSAAAADSVAAPASGRVTVTVDIAKFKATQKGPQAVGTATAQLRGLGGMPESVTQKVKLAVTKKGSCNILTLVLDQLDLKLLGLNVHLDKVDLRVTGKRSGGVLGRLFCSLAGAKVKAARAHAARKLNRHLRKTGKLRLLRLTVPVSAVSSQVPLPVCQVLELTLGPLHLDLLGLIVDLNKVHLTITATPGGGILGNLFCGLANGPAPAA